MPTHRMIVFAVLVMILTTMLLLVWQVSAGWPGPWVMVMVFGPPIVASGVVLAPLPRKQRIVGLYLAAFAMVPAAAFGIVSGWGLLYILGIIFVLYAAWQDNEGRT